MPRPPEGLTAVSCRETQCMPVVPAILPVDGDGNYRRMVKDMILNIVDAELIEPAVRENTWRGDRDDEGSL